MSREPKRMDENVRGSSKLIIYIAVSTVIATVIVSYILIGNMINSSREEKRLAELESQEQQEDYKISEISRNEETESVSTEIGKTVEESNKENEETTNTKNANVTAEEKKSDEKENTSETANEIQKQEEQKEITFIMPVEGEIVRGFAKDNLVYSETLQEWMVHQAIDIKANSRDVVKSAAEGTVTAIKNDPRYGLTVIIEHDNGFKTVYSNLLTSEFVVEGEKVKQGQTLGTVGNSASFEIVDEPHLHFEMLKNSEYVDPTIYIK